MTTSRRYDDPCGIARALDRIGERWALLVVRELMLGPKRFTDLKQGLPSASPNVLSQRLDELIEAGIVERKQLAPPAAAWVYELTPWGQELDGVLLALARWGSRAVPVPRGELSIDALLLALRTTLDVERAMGPPLVVALRVGLGLYHVRIAAGTIEIARGGTDDAQATIATDAGTLRRLVFRGITLAAARQQGLVEISGSLRAAARFVASFRRPAPVAA